MGCYKSVYLGLVITPGHLVLAMCLFVHVGLGQDHNVEKHGAVCRLISHKMGLQTWYIL